MKNNDKITSDLGNAELLARNIGSVLIEKKALDVRLYCVAERSPITDYYINATGRSSTNVAALADEVICKMSEGGREALRVEGRGANSWILIDYGDVIVNVFDKQSRDFYNFDRLFSEAEQIDLSDIIAQIDDKFKIENMKGN